MAPKKPCPPSPFILFYSILFKPLKLATAFNINKKMKELAKQELKLLEAQYPTRFHYLKLQLKEFIHLLDEEEEVEEEEDQQFYSSLITQESSSSRKRQREEEMDDGYNKPKPEAKIRRRKEGICDAIHKAEACLHKIQTLKSFFCSSDH